MEIKDVTTNNTRSSCINVTIPEAFNIPGIRFIKVLPNEKKAFEKAWETDSNYPIDHFSLLAHLKSGGNYGILSGYGNIGCFDADNFEKLEKYRIIKELDALGTITVQRGTHRHYYFIVDGELTGKHELVDPNIPKKDRKKENREEWAVGDVRIGGTFYTVGPNSIHPSGEKYEIISGTELKHVQSEWLHDLIYYLEPNNQEIVPKKVNNGTLTDFLNLRVTDYLNPVGDVVKMGSVEQGSHPIHGSTTGHNFRVDSSMNTFSCFSSNCTHLMVKAVGGSGLEAYAVSKGLMECEDCVKGWSESRPDLFKKIVYSLRQDGYGKKIDEWYGKTTIADKTTKKVNQLVKPEQNGNIEHPRLHLELEDGNWIKDYMTYCKKEMPQVYEDFYLAGALSLLSIATDRRVVFNVAGRPHYLVVWCMGIGKSTISHKSDMLDEIRKATFVSFNDKELPYPGSASGLFDDLAEKPNGYLIIDECASLLSNINNNKEAGQARATFCRIYDCDERITKSLSRRTKNAPLPILNPFVPMLWFTQPSNFASNTSKIDVESGFLSRFLYFNPNYKKAPIPLEITSHRKIENLEIYRRLKTIINKLKTRNVIEVAIPPDTMKIFHEWQISEETRIQDETDDPNLPSIFGRMMIYTIKIAALFTIADQGFDFDVDINSEHKNKIGKDISGYTGAVHFSIPVENMERAINLTKTYLLPHSLLTLDQIGINEEKNCQDKIMSYVRSYGGKITRSQLGKCVHMKARDLEDHLDALVQSEEIIRKDEPGDLGRTREVIFLR